MLSLALGERGCHHRVLIYIGMKGMYVGVRKICLRLMGKGHWSTCH